MNEMVLPVIFPRMCLPSVLLIVPELLMRLPMYGRMSTQQLDGLIAMLNSCSIMIL